MVLNWRGWFVILLFYLVGRVTYAKICANDNQCSNGGTCTSSFICICDAGYTGDNCDDVVTTVAPTDVITTVAPTDVITTVAPTDVITTVAPTDVITTVAPTDVITTVAPTDVIATDAPSGDPCIPSPCQPFETCVVSAYGYICECPPGKEGPNCEVNIPATCSLLCSGNGQCYVNSLGSDTCRCNIGHGGTYCEKDESYLMKCPKPIGVGINKEIESVSSFVNEDHSAKYARLLHPFSAWCADPRDTTPFLIIGLGNKMNILAIVTRGEPGSSNYVKSFKLFGKHEPGDAYVEHESFETSSSEMDFRWINPPLVAYEVNISVTNKGDNSEYACMQVELYGCNHIGKDLTIDCFETIGVPNTTLFPPGNFDGTDDLDGHPAHEARLNGDNAYCSSNTDKHLKITVPQMEKQIVGIITQGYYEGATQLWVSQLEIKDKTTSTHLTAHAAGVKHMITNMDGYSPVVHFFDVPFDKPYDNPGTVMNIKDKDTPNKVCLRVDFIGCDDVESNPCDSFPCQHGGTCSRTSKFLYTCICRPGFQGLTCSDVGACYQDINYAFNEAIHSSHIDPPLDNMNDVKFSSLSVNTWCATANDVDPFLEIILTSLMSLTGVIVAGHHEPGNDSLVKKFIMFRTILDSDDYQPILADGVSPIFTGVKKSGSDHVEYTWNDEDILAYTVRFEFTEFYKNKPKCFKVQLKGCPATYEKKSTLCQNGGELTTTSYPICKCQYGFEGLYCETAVEVNDLQCVPTLGLADKIRFPDYRMTATGFNIGNEAHFARLNYTENAWCIDVADFTVGSTVIHISLGAKTGLFGISTQGHPINDFWVSSYRLNSLETVAGNTDGTTVVTHMFSPFTTYKVYFKPDSSTLPQICARIELYGLNEETLSQFLLAPPSIIPDASITASGFLSGYEPANARLQNEVGSWCAPADGSHYLQINFDTVLNVSMIVTAGNPVTHAMTFNYYFNYTVDKINWQAASINGTRLFSGNWNTATKNIHVLLVPIPAIAVRFIPNLYHNEKCLRVDVHGCGYRKPLKSAVPDSSTTHVSVSATQVVSPTSGPVSPTPSGGSVPDPATTPVSVSATQVGPVSPTPSGSGHIAGTSSVVTTSTPENDMCDTANCHHNATCNVVNETAICSCNEGFTGNGTYCSAFYPWGDWQTCSVTCGNGTSRRTRACVDPNADNCAGNTEELKTCFLTNCPVNGNWSAWLAWSSCSATCGSGVHSRSRNCTSPEPAHGGTDCTGLGSETDVCVAAELCAGEEGYGHWTNWTTCSKSCGSGFKIRTRTCIDAALGCTEKASQKVSCYLVACPVDGNYTEWGNWTTCSAPCGPGEIRRTRNCTNPAPAYGGKNCEGPNQETEACMVKLLCDGDFGYGDWSSWSPCTTSCASGTRWRSRLCSISNPGDSLCTGPSNETGVCDPGPCPIDGKFSEWTAWADCSVNCGFDQVDRTRSCSDPAPQYGGILCYGEDREIRDCILPVCPENMNYSPWSSWSLCSVSCSNGIQTRTRQCQNSTGYLCDGPAVGTKECLLPKCPVHGGFGEWTGWSVCQITCGSAFVQRSRDCNNPLPAYNGSDCLGLAEESKVCSMPELCPDETGFTLWSIWSPCDAPCSTGHVYRQRNCTDSNPQTCEGSNNMNTTCYAGECPIDGQYSEWLSWSSCSGNCGSGYRTRLRTCTNPEPAYDGAGCSGASEKIEDCQHSTPCSGEDGYEQWSLWSVCTQTCGSSIQLRTRKCRNGSKPEDCSAASNQTKPCDFGLCPVHGQWSDWSGWGSCSASCNSGGKLRSRTCTNPVPSYGGLPCYGDSDEYETCVLPEKCQDDDEFSDWGQWGECSESCGDGTRKRSRYCTVLPTYPPAVEPYCADPTEQFIECNDGPCKVDGNFTTWTGWSACSKTCGLGTQQRYRNCTNPPPLFNGVDCLGHLYEVKECEISSPCPGGALCSPWSSWDQCSSSCEGSMLRNRDDLNPVDAQCSPLNYTMDCNTAPCPVDGIWSTWTEWSSCDKTCGYQEEVRTRACDNPTPRNGGAGCSGHNIEVMPCSYYDYIPCPDPPMAQWSDWSWWTVCNTTCGGGRQHRYRLCSNPPPSPGYPGCDGETDQIQDCNIHPCSIDGNFTLWSEWTECTLICANGTQVRGRSCSNPSPEHGGKDCEGDPSQLRHCNVHPCPIHGGFTQWTPWTYCSKPCDTGYFKRQRSCTNPTPMYSGNNCTGDSLQSNDCNTNVCPPVTLRLSVTFTDVLFTDYQSNTDQFKTNTQTLIQSPYDSAPPSLAFSSCTSDANGLTHCDIDLMYQSIPGDELVVLQDKLLDENSHTNIIAISSDVLLASPLTVQTTPVSSTSLNVQWTALDPSAQTSGTSTLTGYIIFYKPEGSSSYEQVAMPPDKLENALEELKKFTSYRVVVSPYSANGVGVPSLPVQDKTLEDVPSVAPVITRVQSPSTTSLNLTWTAIEERYLHGIPLGYCVHYRASDSSLVQLQEISNISQLDTTITGLAPYTRYFLQVAAKTTPGCGEQAEADIYTLEEAPTGPPLNVRGQNSSSTSILVQWDNVEPDERKGRIIGFIVSYTLNGVTQTVDVPNGDARQVDVKGLKAFTPYDITVLAYNSAGRGPGSSSVTVSTDESTPSQAPLLIKAQNTSSTGLFFKWGEISPQNYQGIFLGYRIYYRPKDTERKVKVIDLSKDTLEYEFTDLFMWWWYEIQLAGFTRVGSGVMVNVTVQTDEEQSYLIAGEGKEYTFTKFPSRYPENIRGIALSPTSMLIEWDTVLPGFVHGILLKYKLIVRETNDLNNIIVDTEVSRYERSYYLEGLKKYTNYTIWVGAINSKGLGVMYQPGHINTTGEDGPEIPPDNIRVSTLTHISQINIEWTRIPAEFHNGILRGYYIEYTALVLAGEVIPKDQRVVQSIRIRGNRYAHVLRDLHPASKYEIVIFGYTIKNGTKSNASIAETCTCPKYIGTNWFQTDPYTDMFATIINICVQDICKPCVNGHGETELCLSDDCKSKRRRRRSSSYSRKNSQYEVSSNIDSNNYEISFPVQGNKYVTSYAGVFPYISVVDAPGSAYFTVKNVPSTSEVVVNASIACMPVILLMTLFAWIAGIIIWVLERKKNPDHFPESFTKGVPEGFWWAFISMTTVGYGDRSPTTVPGRLFAIVWILMGLVIVSIVTGGIVTSITSVLVIQEDKLYGAQVAAVKDSAEYRKAIRQNADVVGYDTMEQVISAMANKEVAGALLDMYGAATKKSLLQSGGDIQMNRMVEYPTGYGIVLSGDMIKASPLFYEVLGKRKSQVSQIIEENTETISQSRDEAEEAKELSSGLFDPSADAFKKSFHVTISLLVVAIVIGLIYHFRVYSRKEKEKKKRLDALKENYPTVRVAEFLKNEGRAELEDFTQDLQEQIEALRKKQIRERKKTWLYKAEKAKNRPRPTGPPTLQRSAARVCPEVNEGMDYTADELKENSISSLRQSSLSIFDEIKRSRSPRVHPASIPYGHNSSNIELNDLIPDRRK